MNLKPQDVLIVLKLAASPARRWTYQQLAAELGMSPSEVHSGIRRAAGARLINEAAPSARPVAAALEEFLVHGIRYAFPPVRRGPMQGLPTGYAAPPLDAMIAQPDEPPPVWPKADGPVRGYGLEPIYPSVPMAASRDPALYQLLALVDALRDGRARERSLAAKELAARFSATG